MPPVIVWLFLTLSVLFTVVHNFAVFASLYWYYAWFDIVMHLWGGVLVSLGIIAFAKFTTLRVRPTPFFVLGTLLFVMLAWEGFEFFAGLYNPATYVYDFSKDLLFGLIGGLFGYSVLRYFTIMP